MTEPFLVVEQLTDIIDVDPARSLEASLIVAQPVDIINLETDVLIGQGPAGPPGPSPLVSKYAEATAVIVSGVLTLNAAAASTFYVVLNQEVTGVVVTNWASDRAQRIHVYTEQAAPGDWGYASNAFPAGTKWSYGMTPEAAAVGKIESFVLEHLPGVNLIFGALVGQDYT